MATPKDLPKKTSPTVVYGGPYLPETEAIIAESLKENPDYDGLVKNWKTISTGAQAYIEQIQKPVKAPTGKFVKNVIEKEPEAPKSEQDEFGL